VPTVALSAQVHVHFGKPWQSKRSSQSTCCGRLNSKQVLEGYLRTDCDQHLALSNAVVTPRANVTKLQQGLDQ